jgi:hypothetical protein
MEKDGRNDKAQADDGIHQLMVKDMMEDVEWMKYLMKCLWSMIRGCGELKKEERKIDEGRRRGVFIPKGQGRKERRKERRKEGRLRLPKWVVLEDDPHFSTSPLQLFSRQVQNPIIVV